jgi:hypothetical protein
MQIRQWFSDEWKEVRSKVKYDIYKWSVFWLGAFVVTSGAYFVHRIWHVPEWAPYAVVFILSLFAFLWMSRYASTATGTNPSNLSVSPTQVEGPVDPKKPNLRVERKLCSLCEGIKFQMTSMSF